MQNQWRTLFAASLLGLGFMGASLLNAHAIDLSPRPEATPITSVSDIESGNLKLSPWGVNTMLEPQKFQTLEYRPTTVAEIQGTPADIHPVTQSPQDVKMTLAKPAYLVFPVLVHDARDKAFSDLPIMMSSAVANQLSKRFSYRGYGVMNPIYAYDALREKRLTHLYETIMRDYVEAGAPNVQDIEVLADQLSTPNQQVNWVIFVEAGFDTDHTRNRVGKMETLLYNITDIAPKQPNFFLNGAVRVFNVHSPERSLWTKSAMRRMTQDSFTNFTKSVFDDSDSVLNFRNLSVDMAQEMVGGMRPPKKVPQSKLSGEIVTNPAGVIHLTVTPQDQQALKTLQNNAN